jgi:CHAT domain-containing protein
MLRSNGKYLIETYPIQYQSSIALWLELNQAQEATVHSMLAMSPAFTDNELASFERRGLVALANADKECEQISRIWNGQWLAGQRASKANFLRRADESDIIHLATHASADDRAGLFSWLAFSSSGNDSLLYLDEIYSLSLDARMVVLSGCETGIGPLQTGEGLISLSRAFSYAGAESIITSLWPVQDAATAKIMTAFYTHLRNGESKDRALQIAKIEYLNSVTDPTQADPYYWAGFVAIGNMTPLTLEKSYNRWLTMGLIVIGLIGVWVGVRAKRFRTLAGASTRQGSFEK